MSRFLYLNILIILFYSNGFSQKPDTNQLFAEVCLSPAESELYLIITEYRKKKGLPAIKISRSLCYVAKTHAKDQAENHNNGSRCNMHSWSKSTAWSSCCYTPDHKQAKCMWDKPRELTAYQGDGFEISFWSTYQYATPREAAEDILNGWKKSPGHNNLIINNSNWKKVEWKAIGIGIYGEYANVWFGEDEDSAPVPELCE